MSKLFGCLICALCVGSNALGVEVRHIAQTKVEAKILAALDKPFDFDYEAMPLSKVVSAISERFAIPVNLDVSALEASAISPDCEVTIHLKGATLEAGLQKLARDLYEVSFVVTPKALVITSADTAESEEIIRVYDASRFSDPAASPDPRSSEAIEGVANLVRDFVIPEPVAAPAPDAKEVANGGRGTVRYVSSVPFGSSYELSPRVGVFGHLLIVKASASQQAQVQSLLSQVYAGLNPEQADAEVPVTP